MTALTVDLRGCARCDGDGHPELVFRPLERPVLQGDVVVATHWSPCPTNGEPILLTVHATSGEGEHAGELAEAIRNGAVTGAQIQRGRR